MPSVEEERGRSGALHVVAEVVHVIVSVLLPGIPLVGAGWVFSTAIAGLSFAIQVLIDFSGAMVVLDGEPWRDMRDDVFVVSDTVVVCDFGIRELVVELVSNSRLAEVGHGGVDAIFLKGHGGQLGKSCSETVASCLDRVSRVCNLESLDFSHNTGVNSAGSRLETFVHTAVAFRPGSVVVLEECQVRDPVGDGGRSSEHDVDGIVGGQVTDVTLSVVSSVVDHRCSDKACGSAAPSFGQVLVLPAVSISRQNNRDVSFNRVVSTQSSNGRG